MDKKQIKMINTHGITYLDASGQEVFIDFRECYENYLKRRLSSEGWHGYQENNGQEISDWNTYLKTVIAWREVGWRNAEGFCFELHTDPPTLFEFEAVEEFQKMIYAIHYTGWATFDMS